jgi:ribosomal protein S12 methylthiotransferase accessory factor YcaO
VVLYDRALAGVSFGSGSSVSHLADAVERAVTEAVQVREQLRRVAREPAEHRGRYDDCGEWLEPAFVDAVLRHVAAATPVRMGSGCNAAAGIAATPVDVAVECIERRGSRLLVVDLPSPVRGWHVVRALAPGLCLHPHRSDSAGGRRLPAASLMARGARTRSGFAG